MTRGNLFEFVRDIGIPSKSCKVERGVWACCTDVGLSGVRKMDLAAVVLRGQTDNETPYHAWGFLRVLVGSEERALLV